MKNSYILKVIIVFLIALCSCKEHNSYGKQRNNVNTTNKQYLGVENSQKHTSKDNIDNCKKLLRQLIASSSIQNPFIKNIDINIDKIEKNRMTIMLYDSSDTSQNTIGSIIIDGGNKKILDVTNDIENPIVLKYNSNIWNKVIDCYFNSDQSLKINNDKNPNVSNCKNIHLDDGLKQECIFKNTTPEVVYQKTIAENEIDAIENLPVSLPYRNGAKEIKNGSALISISYTIIKKTKIIFELTYEGGVTKLSLEQIGNNVRRTIVYSAD